MMSWLTGSKLKNHADRVAITIAGVAPDLDGIGILVDLFTGKTRYFFQYHHVLGHSLISAIGISLLVSVFAVRKKLVFAIALIVTHLHYFCDWIGSMGPNGETWPIAYLYPFSNGFLPDASFQWKLNDWQNQVILIALVVLTASVSIRKGNSIFEIFGRRFDHEVFKLSKKVKLSLSKIS